jgi:hypothetical protein
VLDPENAGRRRFLFVMVENEPPYALTVHEMSEAVMTIGRKQLDYAIRIWRECIMNTTARFEAIPAARSEEPLLGLDALRHAQRRQALAAAGRAAPQPVGRPAWALGGPRRTPTGKRCSRVGLVPRLSLLSGLSPPSPNLRTG